MSEDLTLNYYKAHCEETKRMIYYSNGKLTTEVLKRLVYEHEMKNEVIDE